MPRTQADERPRNRRRLNEDYSESTTIDDADDNAGGNCGALLAKYMLNYGASGKCVKRKDIVNQFDLRSDGRLSAVKLLEAMAAANVALARLGLEIKELPSPNVPQNHVSASRDTEYALVSVALPNAQKIIGSANPRPRQRFIALLELAVLFLIINGHSLPEDQLISILIQSQVISETDRARSELRLCLQRMVKERYLELTKEKDSHGDAVHRVYIGPRAQISLSEKYMITRLRFLLWPNETDEAKFRKEHALELEQINELFEHAQLESAISADSAAN